MSEPFDPHHDHDHPHDAALGPRPLPMIEEPLDPANQSLADALRASFRILKLIMVVVFVFFLCSGFYIVDQNEVVVLTRLGRRVGEPKKAGFHAAWPYPIDQKTRIRTDTQTLEIKSFWMKLAKEDELKPYSHLSAARTSLQPGVDGALLTAVERRGIASGRESGEGAELVHVKWNLAYRIVKPLDFVENITNEETTLESIFDAASVAMAARSTVDDIAFQNQAEYRSAVQRDAQRRLDAIKSGIVIDKVNSVAYQPLQVRDEFNAVVRAENKKRSTTEGAEQERKKVLNEAAGEAYEEVDRAIREYELARLSDPSPKALAEMEANIDNLLLTKARGRAAEIVKIARAQSDQIVQQARADADTLRRLKPRYDETPVLLPARLWQEARREIFASDGVTRFFVPDSITRLAIWLNRDPEQERQKQIHSIAAGAGQKP